MNISKHRRSLGPALSRLAGGILCLVWLQCLAAGDVLAAQDDESFFTHLHTEKAMANVTVSPGRAGPVEIAIQLETTDELPLVAQAVSITLTDMQTGKQLEKAQAMRTAEDQWQVKIPMLSAGRWMFGLGISISDADRISVEAPISISPAAAAGDAVKHHQH
jgi:copper transport protein